MEKIDHIAVVVPNVKKSVQWYQQNTDCKVNYQDDTWAELQYSNVKLALVTPAEHPPHIAFIDENVTNGTKHRDGSESVYEHDYAGNIIERIKYPKKSKKIAKNKNQQRRKKDKYKKTQKISKSNPKKTKTKKS